MKKSISLLAISVVLIALFFSGCKKGENDPFLTLKSRTSRLAKDWKLTSGSITEVSTYPDGLGGTTTSTTVTTYTDATKSVSSGGNTSTYAYSEEITFDKKGTYEMTTIDDGDASTEGGNWSWLRKDKNNDLKDKEAIIMTGTKYSEGGDSETIEGKSNDDLGAWVIDKLSSKELVVLFDYKYTGSNGYIHTKQGTITFSKK